MLNARSALAQKPLGLRTDQQDADPSRVENGTHRLNQEQPGPPARFTDFEAAPGRDWSRLFLFPLSRRVRQRKSGSRIDGANGPSGSTGSAANHVSWRGGLADRTRCGVGSRPTATVRGHFESVRHLRIAISGVDLIAQHDRVGNRVSGESPRRRWIARCVLAAFRVRRQRSISVQGSAAGAQRGHHQQTEHDPSHERCPSPRQREPWGRAGPGRLGSPWREASGAPRKGQARPQRLKAWPTIGPEAAPAGRLRFWNRPPNGSGSADVCVGKIASKKRSEMPCCLVSSPR